MNFLICKNYNLKIALSHFLKNKKPLVLNTCMLQIVCSKGTFKLWFLQRNVYSRPPLLDKAHLSFKVFLTT